MSTEVNANVIKRNGVEVIFDKAKIINAVEKANKEVPKLHRLSHYQITALADMIATRALESSHAVNVEDIQDMVETGIMEMRGYEVAQKYVRYRYKRELTRKSNTTDDSILALLDQINENAKQENSNKNPTINSTQRDYMAGEVSKDLTMRVLLPEEIVKAHEKGQPVLVGTITIETSEMLSQMLKKRGVPHKVLNAKYHELEAEIVAQAGIHGAVTIATNMAGRGTDIKLDDESKALGGLKIIGTERHESRRIDNQLRGRAGRQGDPGESRFYISLEDDLMRLFGSDKLMSMFNALGVPENEQIEHKMLSSAIEKAQQKIETNNYGIRENLLKYDEVNNEQREVVYAERRQVLDGENMRELIMKMLNDIVEGAVDMSVSDEQTPENWGFKELNDLLLPIIPLKPIELTDEISKMSKDEFKHMLKELATKFYESKEAEFPDAEQVREIERVVLLKVIDNKWMSHIDDMDQLREGIGLQAYGNRDPLVEYKMNAYEMFDDMTAAIREDTIRILCHIRVEEKVEREPAAKVTGTNRDDSAARAPQRRQTQKIYPNDPCPCGSGKKYKQCCGRKPLA